MRMLLAHRARLCDRGAQQFQVRLCGRQLSGLLCQAGGLLLGRGSGCSIRLLYWLRAMLHAESWTLMQSIAMLRAHEWH